MDKISKVKIGSTIYELHDSRVHYGSFSQLSQSQGEIPERGHIYVYSDRKDASGKAMPGIKIADGKAYLADLPFINPEAGAELLEHINSSQIHITQSEREKWNGKVACEIRQINDRELNLIFYTEQGG